MPVSERSLCRRPFGLSSRASRTGRAWACRLAVLALALLLAGCPEPPSTPGTPSQPGATRTLRLAVLAVEGQNLSGMGQAYKNIAKMVQTEVERAGGVALADGRAPLEVAVLVHGEDVESALRALRQAAGQGAIAIIGGAVSRQALPMAALAEELQVPLVSPGSTHPDLVGGRAYVFRVPYSDVFQAKALARMCRDSGAGRAAVFYSRTDIYSSGLAREFASAFRALGGRMVAEEGHVNGQKGLVDSLRPIAKARPDVLFLPGYHTDVPEQIRLVRGLGYTGDIVGPDGWDLLSGHAPVEMIGARFLVPWGPGAPQSPLSAAFVERYTAAFGRQPTSVDALVYDAFSLVLQAAAKARHLDAAGLRQELARVAEFTGVAGRAIFLAGSPERDAQVMEVSSRGVQYAGTLTVEAVAGR